MTDKDQGRRVNLSYEEFEGAIARGAETGAKKVLEGLGVDVANPLEMQKDFAWIRDRRQATRKLVDAGKTALVTSIIGAIVTGFALAWTTFAKVFSGAHHP